MIPSCLKRAKGPAGPVARKAVQKGRVLHRVGTDSNRSGICTEGSFSQSHISESEKMTIKYFFPKERFAASVGAMLAGTPSAFAIVALEDTRVLSYKFSEFRKLTEQYNDIASFYIRYMERHWIVEKEPLEISFRHDTALKRYHDFLHAYPGLIKRLKKHQIASYLGITPTQLSRLNK